MFGQCLSILSGQDSQLRRQLLDLSLQQLYSAKSLINNKISEKVGRITLEQLCASALSAEYQGMYMTFLDERIADTY